MNKHLRLLALPILLLATFPLTSCSQDCSEYVGDYYLDVQYEKTVHYYWGSKNELERKDVSGLDNCTGITIYSDRSVAFHIKNQDDKKGKIVVFFGQASFRSLPFSDSYKFKVKEQNGKKVLEHSWSEDKHGLEYDEKSRRIVFIEKDEIID